MTIVNSRLNQSSTRSLDDANGFFRVKRGLNWQVFPSDVQGNVNNIMV